MKLLRYGEPHKERPGLLDREGAIRDLSHLIPDLAGEALSPSSLRRLRDTDPASLPLVEGNVRIGPCVGKVGHFIAIGLNYRQHAIETNLPLPAEPIVFSKAPSCISGAYDPIVLPRGSEKTDWEVELAAVIGERCFDVAEENALGKVAGYCICHDVSERNWQIERGGQWMKGKSAPSFGPLGPWLVTPDEIPDVQDLELSLDLNGERMQASSTGDMVFGLAELISYVSQMMILEPGDVIATGTPSGVGLGMTPPRYLKPGDVVELRVSKLGVQRQVVGDHTAMQALR